MFAPSHAKSGALPGIQAKTLIPGVRAEEVFRFLEDLENHWLITDGSVEVMGLSGPRGRREGARVRLRGPLGISRTALTRIDRRDPPRELVGTAALAGATRAQVKWLLSETTGGARIELAARITAASGFDRLLWRAGGRRWMQARMERALAGLRGRLARDAGTV